MTEYLTLDVRGTPRAQGSMRLHRMANGKVATRYPPQVWEWRAQVQQVAAEAMVGREPFLCAVELRLDFDLSRPAGHYGTGRNAAVLRASAPRWPRQSPDLDKLCRAVCDALTDAGCWKDDSVVAFLIAAKRYADEVPPGVRITVKDLS